MADQQFSHEDYTIGWICALPETEMVAAAAMLDEEHPALPAADPQDANSYLLGRTGDHNVVIACLPAEETGKVSAATVARDMVRSFPSIRFGLMVGIGGGVPYHGAQEQDPSHKNGQNDSGDESDGEEIPDVRLGDVVISLHSKSTEAVVQYDFGKSLQEKEFIHTGGKLNKPPRIVLNAVARLKADHARGRSKIPELLSQMVSENPAMEVKFQHQGFEKDRLLKPNIVHVEGKRSCKACCGPDNVNLIRRKERSGTAPKIHYGTIGSADQVMKDAILRDQWASKENILCFEMEAAGLMDSFPCLIIRGICDYADSHKNKIWQPYAAATAALYAKELLLVIPGQGVSMLSPIKQLPEFSKQLKDLNHGLGKAFEQRENHHQEQVKRNLTEDQRHCHQAFKTSTYEKHKNRNPDRVQGTCEWVLNSVEYLHWWKATNNDLLWISADPGCGKSVLAKSLVDDILKAADPKVTIVYFFFKDNDEQNNLATALCAVLHQLFSLQPQLLRHALPFWEKSREKIQYEVEDLWRIFMAAMSDLASSNTICVFDALDECGRQDRNLLIEKLQKYHAHHQPPTQKNWLKFIVTSRPYDDIKDHFRPVTKSFPHIHLRGEEENDQIHKEINLVVKIKVAELDESLDLSAQTRERLERELLYMEHRTYLWLYLAIDDIRTTFKDSLWPNQESIPLIPKTVDAAYEKILDRVTPEKEATVRTILQIIVGARRPLTIQEMVIALGVSLGRERIAEDAGVSVSKFGEIIRRLCGLFIFIKDSRIYLIHQTAREFLVQKAERSSSFKWYLEPSETEIKMTQICVRYLLMDDLILTGGERGQHLLEYSSQNWADHYRGVSSPITEIAEAAYQLYDFTAERFNLWFPVFWKATMPYKYKPKMHALHLAALNGHDDIILRLLLQSSSTPHHRDSSRTTALQYASWRGNYKSVDILLEKGADINARGGQYGNALQAASQKGHLDIVEVLLEKGANANAQGGQYGNALQAASQKGHLDIVEVLLEKGADVNAQGGWYGNALQAASQKGHLDIVKVLLEKGVDVNAQGGQYGNALQAASLGHLDIVRVLLETGTDINAQGGQYGNALQAASLGHLDIVTVLLEKGADANAQGGRYGNALQAASHRGYLDIVEVLLEKGADINAQGGEYGNALQAASLGHLDIVKVLLETGTDINAQGGQYGNALQAASLGHLDIVRVLLEKGADINAQGGWYGNALQAASQRGHLDIVKVLLEKGADINAQGGKYGNALQAASLEHLDIVEVLLETGVDINAQGGEYGTALQAASHIGHLDIVKVLLEKGADINAQGGQYGNALQAASLGHLDIVRILLETGVDINAQGGEYGNALQAASLRHLDIVKVLLEKGADVNAQGGEYGTALQAASLMGYLDIVKVLLEKGADVNAQGGEYGNALQAASLGHLDIVKVLLEKGADVNVQGGRYGTALQTASLIGHLDIVIVLLEKGANANAQGGQFGNALEAASQKGHLDIVKVLLEKGADINAQGGKYGNALQAASLGHLVIVKVLLEKGANVNAQGGWYGNALQAASHRGYLDIVEVLLEKGADVNAQGGQYGNALQAASLGHLDIVKVLLKKGADINAQGGQYGNALQAASLGHLDIVKVLLEKGADVNAQGGEYGNICSSSFSR
ncbi:Pfs, NACHT and ankyrin domain protein [Talaromyces proteolyticus]|uniref:Pfs, NACHT and ankyrin domain protein n=1 Tax=Talaromyces proteolyticus TaxID=1131652 RepID=A0AAD4Q034_9EURO|nr:Pfs, NACHT and ankyrin domain protein [Talaromyces proteolyticus]KAH8696488.1 Pfs, NACHT and ankyrin domain protein [Talaromyces proteolyticus]